MFIVFIIVLGHNNGVSVILLYLKGMPGWECVGLGFRGDSCKCE